MDNMLFHLIHTQSWFLQEISHEYIFSASNISIAIAKHYDHTNNPPRPAPLQHQIKHYSNKTDKLLFDDLIMEVAREVKQVRRGRASAR